MNWWEDPINRTGTEIVFQTPEEILREGLENIERNGLLGQRGSTKWVQAVKAGSILDKAYGKERNR